MKKIVYRYGWYAALFEFIFFVLAWLIFGLAKLVDPELQGAFGWVCIICPMIFVYFGIRYYRDHINGGTITLLKALQVGLLIVIIPTLAYAVIETVYVIWIDPKFYERIAGYEMEAYRKQLSPAAYAAKVKEMKAHLAIDNNPQYNFLMMILMIGALGSIVAVLSSFLLWRKQPKAKASVAA